MKKGLFKFILCCLVTLIFTLNGSSIFANTNDKLMMQGYFDQAEDFKEATSLSNPEDIDPEGSITKSSDDFSNLSNMRDQELTHQGANLLNNSEDGALLIDSDIAKNNAINEHSIDNDNALIKQAQEIANDPLKVTEGTYYSASENTSRTTYRKSCEEGGEVEIELIRTLMLEVELHDVLSPWQERTINISGEEICRQHYHWLQAVFWKKNRYGMHMRGDVATQQDVRRVIAEKLLVELDQIGTSVGISSRGKGGFSECRTHEVKWDRYHFTYQYREKKQELREKSEFWVFSPEALEDMLVHQECIEISRNCLDSSPKIYFEKYIINRPCFKERIKYQCHIEPQNGCRALKKQGCNLIGSTCLQYLGNYCLKWKRDFECHGMKSEMNSMIKDSEIFCLGGECFNPTIERNADIENISYLSLLNEMKKDMQVNPISVFKGAINSCRKINIGSFINCCSSMKGWGSSMGLAQCKAEEKSLALKRSKGLCTYVGTYCSTKDPITKRCITKKSSFCCYNSKLAKVFQEQGRTQLGISYGAPQSPNCRGLTTEELQKIDYSKLDLEELFSEMLEDVRSKINRGFSKQIQDQMPKMQSDIKVNGRKALTY